ncbi:MAG: hypothetical protein JSW23_11850 [Planctomycetota bacterium]|nr:MAG: hypothetical protein JSW23_11850 [Planctomycetota bacterium]
MDGEKHKYITKALEMVDELLGLANSKEAQGDENGCGVLSGVLRDCAYKIQQAAEDAGNKDDGKWRKPVEPILGILAAAMLSAAMALPVDTIINLSTSMM